MNDQEYENVQQSLGYRLFCLVLFGPGDFLRMAYAHVIYVFGCLYVHTLYRAWLHWQYRNRK